MIKKVKFDKSNLDDVVFSLNQCSSGSNALVIKNILNSYSLKDFEEFLKFKMGYLNDDRQFNLKNFLNHSIWFSIYYNKEKNNVYTHSNTSQPLHNDNAWFSDPAEMVFLAFQKQASKGGENTIYPLERLLTDLERDEKQLLSDLQSIEVIIKKDVTGKYFNKTNVIKNDSIFWNYYRTEKPNKTIERMCDKFFEFLEQKERTNSVEILKCDSNDILCFNDTKMLHGRTGFLAKKKEDRIIHQSMWYKNGLFCNNCS